MPGEIENMKIHTTVLVLILLPWYFGSATPQDGICFSGSGVTLCCADYQNVNGTCKVCPKGTYGYGCAKTCPEGYYGDACRDRCKCKGSQICDRAYGCVDTVTKACPDGVFDNNCQSTPTGTPKGTTCEGEHRNDRSCDTTSNTVEMRTVTLPPAFTRHIVTTETVNTQETQTTYFSESQNNVIRLYVWSGLGGYIFIFTSVVLLVRYRRKKRRRENGTEGRIRNQQIECNNIDDFHVDSTSPSPPGPPGVSIGKLQQRLPTETPPLPLKPEERVSSDPDYAEILDCDPDYLEPCTVSRVSVV